MMQERETARVQHEFSGLAKYRQEAKPKAKGKQQADEFVAVAGETTRLPEPSSNSAAVSAAQ
jgi:hypothetical protein